MGKLYFKYGAMGSSKTASALMCRFNYMQKGMNVLLLKPSIDNRFKVNEVTSRIGLSAPCYAFSKEENIVQIFKKESKKSKFDVVIVDECQFCTKEQIEQLREITEYVSVLCYGLLTNFKTELFEGSKRLIELADSIAEIKCVCECGRKATINAKFRNGILVSDGQEVDIGAEEKYNGLCYFCYKKEKDKVLRATKNKNKRITYNKIFINLKH
jgi:thymidine kinase